MPILYILISVNWCLTDGDYCMLYAWFLQGRWCGLQTGGQGQYWVQSQQGWYQQAAGELSQWQTEEHQALHQCCCARVSPCGSCILLRSTDYRVYDRFLRLPFYMLIVSIHIFTRIHYLWSKITFHGDYYDTVIYIINQVQCRRTRLQHHYWVC